MTKTQGALILTVRSIFSLAAMEFVIKFHKKTGIRIGVTIAMLGGAAAFFLYGMSGGFAGYCCAAAMSGLAYGFGGMVPVSILINRWFLSRQGLALSVSSAGSGVASIALPPLITYLIETFSLRTTLLLQAAFFVLAGGVIALLVRNKPEDKETTPYVSAKEKRQGKERTYGFDAGRLSMVSMYIAIGMIGMTAFGTIPNFAVHYLGEGFDSMTVSFLISLYGGFLIAGKCIYGYAVDRLGAYRSGFVFWGLAILGVALSCPAGILGPVGVAFSMLCYGIGMPIATVGISVFARDMSTAGNYGKTLRRFQFIYPVGSILISPFPGIIADATGSYMLVYGLLAVIALAAMILVQMSYRRELNVSSLAEHI